MRYFRFSLNHLWLSWYNSWTNDPHSALIFYKLFQNNGRCKFVNISDLNLTTLKLKWRTNTSQEEPARPTCTTRLTIRSWLPDRVTQCRSQLPNVCWTSQWTFCTFSLKTFSLRDLWEKHAAFRESIIPVSPFIWCSFIFIIDYQPVLWEFKSYHKSACTWKP